MTPVDRAQARRRLTRGLAAGATVAAAPVVAAAGLGVRGAHGIYHPPRQPNAKTPADVGLAAQERTIVTSRDELDLAMWVVPSRGPHTVVVCHGMGRNRASVLGHLRLLHDAGHHAAAYDLRNHGESDGDRSVGGMAGRFTSDLRDVLATVRRDPLLGGGGVAVLAFSFSAWPALHVLRDVPLDAVVCDSGPARHIGRAFRHLFDLRSRALPAFAQRPPLAAVARTAGDLAARMMLAVRGWPTDLEGVATPLLFVTGARDRVVPPEQVAAVAACYPQARLWTAPHAIHMNALRLDREEYSRLLSGFLAGAFARAGREEVAYA